MFKIYQKTFRMNLTRFTWSPVCYVLKPTKLLSPLFPPSPQFLSQKSNYHITFYLNLFPSWDSMLKKYQYWKQALEKYWLSCYKLLPFNKISISPIHSAPVKQQYTLCFYKFSFFRCHVLVVSCRICLSLCDLSNLA